MSIDLAQEIKTLAINLTTIHAISLGVHGISLSPFQGIGDAVRRQARTRINLDWKTGWAKRAEKKHYRLLTKALDRYNLGFCCGQAYLGNDCPACGQ